MSKYHQKDSKVYYEGSDVPANLLNVENKEDIHEIESLLIKQAYELFINELDENTKFDEKYFKNIHLRTFKTLYTWAGEYRNIDMSKGGSVFCIGRAVQSELKKLFKQIEVKNYFKEFDDISKKEFSQTLAYFKCELITIHPFYELNGRITRMFFDLIAIYNGYLPIDYGVYTPKEYIDASISCVQEADECLLEKIIYDGLIKN